MENSGEIFEIGEVSRDTDRCSFMGSLEGNFALKCLNTPRTDRFESELVKFAKEKSKIRKYLDKRGYVYEFIENSSLVRAIHVPCIAYYGCLEMFKFSEEIIKSDPEIYMGEGASRVHYGTANIPCEECSEDVKEMMNYWIEKVSKIIPI